MSRRPCPRQDQGRFLATATGKRSDLLPERALPMQREELR
jgi:hypothetical protein